MHWENHLFLRRVTKWREQSVFFLSLWFAVTHRRKSSKERFAVLTDIRDSDCNSSLDFSHHMPQDVCASPHDTLHEVVPCLVILHNLTPTSARPLSQAFLRCKLVASPGRHGAVCTSQIQLCTSTVPSSLQ